MPFAVSLQVRNNQHEDHEEHEDGM